ncbi:hypothetical protein HYFRA_00004219 [Hymenoscyphus fraxineus]|uniref:Uncharacterized protein n=1 Tax=Hymenoscyphus fraxineus TaxID=746836 RepID=A0A9N9KMW4_9HELO|nr:hypothetical protein HYFRA_00004219 [Hymenoscyphus fraxineus]
MPSMAPCGTNIPGLGGLLWSKNLLVQGDLSSNGRGSERSKIPDSRDKEHELICVVGAAGLDADADADADAVPVGI